MSPLNFEYTADRWFAFREGLRRLGLDDFNSRSLYIKLTQTLRRLDIAA